MIVFHGLFRRSYPRVYSIVIGWLGGFRSYLARVQRTGVGRYGLYYGFWSKVMISEMNR